MTGPEQEDAHTPTPPPGLPEGFRAEFAAVQGSDAQLRVIRRHYSVMDVIAARDIAPGTLYALRGQGELHLIECAPAATADGLLGLTLALSGRRMKPASRQTLLDLGKKRQLLRLAPKSEAECIVIDMGSFSQLVTSAQQSGLVPNADAIAFVRDHEFRTKKYQKAFDIIEGLSMRLKAAADQRQQRLRREEIDYKSGTLKMSPKEWQLKQRRDTEQTQKIERARRHFARVLDGLRTLMVSAAEEPVEESP